MLAVLNLERDPLQLADIPGGAVRYVQVPRKDGVAVVDPHLLHVPRLPPRAMG